MKKFLLLFLFLNANLNAFSQFNVSEYMHNGIKLTAKEFYILGYGKNRSDFVSRTPEGKIMKLQKSRYYVNGSDTRTIDIMKYDGQEKAGFVEFIDVKEDLVLVKKRLNLENNKVTELNRIVLKIPKDQKDKPEWSFVEEDGTVSSNKSQFIVFNIRRLQNDGSFSSNVTPVLAIQVLTTEENKAIGRSSQTITYYLKDFGYFGTEIYSSAKDQYFPSEVWIGMTYDAAIK